MWALFVSKPYAASIDCGRWHKRGTFKTARAVNRKVREHLASGLAVRVEHTWQNGVRNVITVAPDGSAREITEHPRGTNWHWSEYGNSFGLYQAR